MARSAVVCLVVAAALLVVQCHAERALNFEVVESRADHHRLLVRATPELDVSAMTIAVNEQDSGRYVLTATIGATQLSATVCARRVGAAVPCGACASAVRS